ncbi:EI24 domain-containing protein [Massilia kyonggiensis]|nr:hypothetical protein [Massilia kyonggiensis]
MKSFFLRWYAALVEALWCMLLGLRSSFSNGLWWRSACLCIAVLAFWIWFYWHFAKQIFIAVGAISIMGTYGALLLGFVEVGGGGGGSVVSMGGIGAGFAQILLYAAAVAAALYVFVFAFLVLTTIRLPLNSLFMDRSADAVARHYRNMPAPEVRTAGRITLKQYALLVGCLFVPILSGWVLLLLAVYLNVRLPYASAVRRVHGKVRGRLPLHDHFPPLLMLGVLTVLAVLVPVLNLLLPAVMCTSVLHLVRRGPQWNASSAPVAVSSASPPDPAPARTWSTSDSTTAKSETTRLQ